MRKPRRSKWLQRLRRGLVAAGIVASTIAFLSYVPSSVVRPACFSDWQHRDGGYEQIPEWIDVPFLGIGDFTIHGSISERFAASMESNLNDYGVPWIRFGRRVFVPYLRGGSFASAQRRSTNDYATESMDDPKWTTLPEDVKERMRDVEDNPEFSFKERDAYHHCDLFRALTAGN